MVYIHDNKPWNEEEDNVVELPRVATHSPSRRERIHGLGIKGFDVPTTSSSSSSSSKNDPKRHVGKRRSIVAFFTKSVETQFTEKFGSARASASQSNHAPSPESPRMSPTLWRTSNPSTSTLKCESDIEDLSTYQANLARFKAERVEREAELGLSNYDLCRANELKSVEKLSPTQKDDSRKSSGLALGRGLRAYWGGGASSEAVRVSSVSKASTIADPYWDEAREKEAFKAWFDRLGSERTENTVVEGRA